MEYAIRLSGQTFTPSGKVDIEDTAAHNARVEAKVLALLKSHPARITVYLKRQPGHVQATTWMGTVLGFGRFFASYRNNFGCKVTRVSINILGADYYGQWSEDTMECCNLRKYKSN